MHQEMKKTKKGPTPDSHRPRIGLQPRRGDIFFADLSEAGNSSKRGHRPVIVIQNNVGNANSGSVIVAAITSSPKRPMPTHVALDERHGLRRPSTAVLEDIITIDKKYLSNFLGTVINTEAERQLDKAIRVSLGLR